MDTCRYTDRFLTLVCANNISGGMPMEVVTLVGVAIRGSGGRGVCSGAGNSGSWEKGGGGNDLITFKLDF